MRIHIYLYIHTYIPIHAFAHTYKYIDVTLTIAHVDMLRDISFMRKAKVPQHHTLCGISLDTRIFMRRMEFKGFNGHKYYKDPGLTDRHHGRQEGKF